MNFYDIDITIGTEWPTVEGDNEHIIRIGRVAGRRVLGWWTTSEMNRWLTSRCVRIISEDGGTMKVVAQLTKKEARR